LSARVISEKLWKYPLDRIIELSVELESLLKKPSTSELELLDLVQKMLPQVRRLLQRKIRECDEKGITPNFRFSEFSENRLVGSLRLESEEAMRHKLLHRNNFYQFLNSLNWKTFENLCLYIIKIYNFKKYDVGKRTKDGGLDFFGFYMPHNVEVGYTGFLSSMNLRIFGQAKHRNKTSITEGEILKFHSQYRDFLNNSGRAYSFVLSKCEWFLSTKGPLIPLFFTNSEFSRDAKKYADRNGILTRDGEQIVEDIIRLSKIEPWFSMRNEKLMFHPDQFRRYLKGMQVQK